MSTKAHYSAADSAAANSTAVNSAVAAAASKAYSGHLAQVFAQYPIEIAHGEGRVAVCARRPQDSGFLRRPRRRRLGVRPSALAGRARTPGPAEWPFRPTPCPCSSGNGPPLGWRNSPGWAWTRCSGSTAGAEANENALRLAFKMTGRSKAVSLEQGWHGRTAAAGAVTWGAIEKWYGFPRTPFDVSFMPRDNPGAAAQFIDRDTAAVIVEPVQGVGGAYDVGKPMLEALRQRCDEVGAPVDFRRGAMRNGPHRRPLRREFLRRDAGHDHGGQGAGEWLSRIGAAAVAPGRGSDQVRRHGHHLRRRPHGLRHCRGGDRHHRIGIAAGQCAPGVGLHPFELRHRSRPSECRARAFCWASKPRGRPRRFTRRCWRRTF